MGQRELRLAVPGTVAELDAAVRAAAPGLARASFRVAVNRRYASDDDPVSPGDEVALIPPVSGG